MTLDIETTIVYIGERSDPPATMGDQPWKHHLYHVTLQSEGRSFEFDYRVGTGWHREPEDVWNDRRFGLPDYLKRGPMTPDPTTGGARYSQAIRARFRKERDEKVIAGALSSIASDLEMFEDYSDDELAEEFSLKPSQIAKARAHVAEARRFLGHHVQEFLDTYRED